MDALSFDGSKARLEEIAQLVEDPDISLDEALALYEEAVKIGLHACDVSEEDVLAQDEAEEGLAPDGEMASISDEAPAEGAEREGRVDEASQRALCEDAPVGEDG